MDNQQGWWTMSEEQYKKRSDDRSVRPKREKIKSNSIRPESDILSKTRRTSPAVHVMTSSPAAGTFITGPLAAARREKYGGSADAFCIETSASVNGIRMTSFCHSLQEAPSSIIQTMTDEFEAVLMELRSYSLDTLERKCEKRSNTFATVRGEAKKTFCRLQDMPKKYEVPISKIQRSIDELKNRNKAEDEEKDALVRRLSEFDEVERKRKAEVEKLREKDELMEAVIELNNENIDLINSGFPIIQRIGKRFPCPHPV